MSSVKKCYIPNCHNTTENKVLIAVPKNFTARRIWWELVHNGKPLEPYAGLFCCEDHFDVPADFENWHYVKMMGGTPLRLKKGVIPHKYLDEPKGKPNESALTDLDKKRRLENIERFKASSSKRVRLLEQDIPSIHLQDTASESGRFIAIQVHLKDGNVYTRTKFIEIVPPSPIKPSKRVMLDMTKSLSVASTQWVTDQASEYIYTTETSTTTDSEVQVTRDGSNKGKRKDSTFYYIEKNPRLYLGLPSDVHSIIFKICSHQQLYHDEILITLKKIRLNDPYSRLGIDFGVSTTHIQRTFMKAVPSLATFMQNFIFWPNPKIIEKLLPIPFRARYEKVQSIINCFEVEIEKPRNPILQAATWSDYKKCNTVKFLISCTPNGLINFISEGFSGRISDKDIVRQSGYIDLLKSGTHILADRGFKHIHSDIVRKDCVLIRPPSASIGKKSSKEEVQLSKQISCLRIHVERVIRCVREYQMLKPHACLNNNYMNVISLVAVIACGLVNLQVPLLV
ncbi:unnamed protein product [Callosobruchus maculatus]|uniref:THAP-type domain-containing protein n=1 Tax=Callosobruchus maculatus TaxID=64391 RepID=A0A653CBX0_CALMS|nr:unnamed protein product [Callosobruchus maculatus]